MNATVLKIAALAFFLPACGCAGRAFFLSQQLWWHHRKDRRGPLDLLILGRDLNTYTPQGQRILHKYFAWALAGFCLYLLAFVLFVTSL